MRRKSSGVLGCIARCVVCHAEWSDGWEGPTAMMLAARHHDATGHPTECEQTIIVRYGDHSPPPPAK